MESSKEELPSEDLPNGSIQYSGQRKEWCANSDTKGDSRLEWLPTIMVNIIAIFVHGSYRFLDPMMDQYLFKTYAKDILGNATVDTTRHPCLDPENTSHSAGSVHRVQHMASSMMLNLSLTTYGLALLPCVVYGVFANNFTRKFLLMAPTFGLAFKCIMIPVIINWELDRDFLYIAYAVDGVCGSGTAVLLGVFIYMSDITSRDHKRTVGMVMIESAMSIFGGILSMAAGQLIEKTGFIIPALISAVLAVTSMLIMAFLPNRKPASLRSMELNWSLNEAAKTLLFPFVYHHDRRVKKMLFLALFAFVLAGFNLMGTIRTLNLYLMNLPFCMDAISIGWYKFGSSSGTHIFGLFAVFVLHRYLPGMGLGLIGAVSMVASYLMYALSPSSTILFINIVLLLPASLPMGVIRGETSRLLGSESQGSLFATIAVLESVTNAAAAPAFIGIYRASLGFFHGLIFVVAAAVSSVILVVLSVFQVIWFQQTKSIRFQELESSKDS